MNSLFQQIQTFFDPDIDVDGIPYKHALYKQIISEQVDISYVSKGISISDTDMLCPYDRKLVLEALVRIKEREEEEMKKAIGEKQSKRSAPRRRKR